MTEMEAFDQLPPLIRTALNYSGAKHSALEVQGERGQKWATERQGFDLVVKTDAAMMMGLPTRAMTAEVSRKRGEMTHRTRELEQERLY